MATVVDTPRESVAVTDSLYVPVSIPIAIVIAPVVVSILMYWLYGVIEKVLAPVPLLAVNPTEV